MKVKKNFPRLARTDHCYAPLHTAFTTGRTTQKMLPTGLHLLETYLALKIMMRGFKNCDTNKNTITQCIKLLVCLVYHWRGLLYSGQKSWYKKWGWWECLDYIRGQINSLCFISILLLLLWDYGEIYLLYEFLWCWTCINLCTVVFVLWFSYQG